MAYHPDLDSLRSAARSGARLKYLFFWSHTAHPTDIGVRGFQESTWQQQRLSIAVEGNYAKFSQSAPLGEFLLNTKQRVLVEASPVDRIWGIGLAVDDPHVENPLEWRGLNLLGFALMAVRERLR